MEMKKIEHLNKQMKDVYSSANYIKREVHDKHMNHGDGIDALCGLIKDMALITSSVIEQLIKSIPDE